MTSLIVILLPKHHHCFPSGCSDPTNAHSDLYSYSCSDFSSNTHSDLFYESCSDLSTDSGTDRCFDLFSDSLLNISPKYHSNLLSKYQSKISSDSFSGIFSKLVSHTYYLILTPTTSYPTIVTTYSKKLP